MGLQRKRRQFVAGGIGGTVLLLAGCSSQAGRCEHTPANILVNNNTGNELDATVEVRRSQEVLYSIQHAFAGPSDSGDQFIIQDEVVPVSCELPTTLDVAVTTQQYGDATDAAVFEEYEPPEGPCEVIGVLTVNVSQDSVTAHSDILCPCQGPMMEDCGTLSSIYDDLIQTR